MAAILDKGRDFLWTLNLYRFWPIMQIRKKGDEIKKKSSPLKLLIQSQPNFAELVVTEEKIFLNFIPPFF
jgi:hypothetical protein